MKATTDRTLLIKSIRYPVSLNHVAALSYGQRMERTALKAYRDMHAKECQAQVVIERKGLKINTAFPFLGACIDGYVKCEKCGDGIVEVKCPYGSKGKKWRQCSIEECCQSTSFCCTWNDGMQLKNSHNYMYQVQGQMAIYQMLWCDFFIWTKKDHGCQCVEFSPEMWISMYEKLYRFYVDDFCAEIFLSRIERNK